MRILGLTMSMLVMAFVMPAASVAGTVRLDGVADGDSTYIEQQSDAFFRMDLYDPPPRETQQRFHLISNPSVTIGNPAFDGFPNDDDFRLGLVTYDESGLVGGTGLAPITALSIGVGSDPTNSAHINYGRWTNIVTEVDTPIGSLNGFVTLVGGIVTSIDFDADVTLTFNPIGSIFLDAPGTFSVHGNRFEGHMQVSSTGNDQNLLIWDFAGTLTTVTVPEPSTWFLATTGALGCVAAYRRRRNARR